MSEGYYVYVLKTVPDGQVFYVGKGSRKRMFWHNRVMLHPSTKEYNRGVYKRMRAFLAGREFIPEKVFDASTETKALLHERALIDRYGFANLVNTQTHAFTGRKLKADARLQMSKSRREYVARLQRERGYKMPPEVAAKISASSVGRTVPVEVGQKISAAKKGVSLTVEHKVALTGVPKTYVSKKARRQRGLRAGASIKALWASGAMTGSRGMQVKFKNPEERARKISLACRGRRVSKATRKKIAATLRARARGF